MKFFFGLVAALSLFTTNFASAAQMEMRAQLTKNIEKLDRKIQLYTADAQFFKQLKEAATKDLGSEKRLATAVTIGSSVAILAPVIVVGGAVVGMAGGIAMDMGSTFYVANGAFIITSVGSVAAPTYFILKQGRIENLQDGTLDRGVSLESDVLSPEMTRLSSLMLEQKAKADEEIDKAFEKAEGSTHFFNVRGLRYAAAMVAKADYMERWSSLAVAELSGKQMTLSAALRNLK